MYKKEYNKKRNKFVTRVSRVQTLSEAKGPNEADGL